MLSHGHGAFAIVAAWQTAIWRVTFQKQSLIVALGNRFLNGERSRRSLLPCAPLLPCFSPSS